MSKSFSGQLRSGDSVHHLKQNNQLYSKILEYAFRVL
jgi:hypothetical protein